MRATTILANIASTRSKMPTKPENPPNYKKLHRKAANKRQKIHLYRHSRDSAHSSSGSSFTRAFDRARTLLTLLRALVLVALKIDFHIFLFQQQPKESKNTFEYKRSSLLPFLLQAALRGCSWRISSVLQFIHLFALFRAINNFSGLVPKPQKWCLWPPP